MGKNLSLGGSARGSNNCCEVDKLFSYFQNHARQNGINEENIVKIKCNSTFSAFDLEKTNTYDKRSNELRTFLRNNPDLCLLNVDKDIFVCFIDRSTYHEKLTELFCDDINFERLTKYNHEIELKSYNKLLSETLGNCLNKKTLQSLEGLHSISSAYGLIKLHKPDNKLRPIITGYSSMVDNAHKWIQKLILPIAKECRFLVDSPKMFKERFLKDCDKFDEKIHQIISFDAKSLYTSVNTDRVISEILKIIYKKPALYFKDKDENGRTLPIPERSNLRKFMHNVLLNHNTFECQLGIFKQRSGLSMGSSLSPSLSNIFVDILEKSVIPKFLKTKEIIHWSRFADDIMCICKKNSVEKIFQKLNSFDHRLKFTIEKMCENKIKFLDCKIFIENSKIKFRKIFKKGLDTVFTNYQHDISPLKYKHNLFTQFHRTRDCCSNNEQFEKKSRRPPYYLLKK